MGRPKLPVTKAMMAFRLDPQRRATLQAEADARGTGISEVMRVHLDRYHELAWRDLPALREAEWCAVFEAMGAPPIQVAGVEWIGATVARGIENGDLARKWKIDATGVASRARAWTFGQQCAVTDAAIRFRHVLPEHADPAEAARVATTPPPSLVLEPARTARTSRK
jgi:hypothetical protein